MEQTSVHENWSGRAGFLLAAVGSAVGLGNIWRFPYVAGENGGGAFVLIYVLCIALVAVPLIMGELAMGRRGRMSPVNTMRKLARDEGRSSGWMVIGWLSVLAPMMGFMFYSVVAGWSLDYIVQAFSGAFSGYDADSSQNAFAGMTSNPWRMAFWHGVFTVMTVAIVARGIRGGLEKAVKIMMPGLFLILAILVGYAAMTADFVAGWNFLFDWDLTKITPKVVLMAVGQAFFSVSVGVGAMLTYGAYLPKNVSIPKAAFVIASADTLVAILAGLAIFPIVFTYSLTPGSGPGLIFETLPIAFGQMPGGLVVGTLFFILMTFAALTSSISMIEPPVSWLEEHKGFSRKKMAIATGAVGYTGGLAALLSFNVWDDVYLLGVLAEFETKTIFGLFDYMTANVLIPLTAMLMAIFVGWRMSAASILEEFGIERGWAFELWRFLMRFVAPLALGAIFYSNIFAS